MSARRPLSLRDPATRAVLALVALAQVWTLTRLEGYQLADSVEYLDRAWDLARGYGVGPESPRSFAFSAAFVPLFGAARALGLEELSGIVLFARMLSMAAGLATVVVVAHTAARSHGRSVGLAAGALLGLSPVFLRYTVAPLSAPFATLALALAFRALFAPPSDRPRDLRQGAAIGLWLSLAILAAYQSFLIAALLLLVALLRDRPGRRSGKCWLGLVAVVLAALLAQCLLDLAVYGRFGSTLLPYLGSNVGGIVSRLLWELGLPDQGAWVYLRFVEHEEIRADYRDRVGVAGEQLPATWYVANASRELLAWPALALVGLGVVALVRRPSWRGAALTFCVLASALFMSFKGSKSFRLWLPLLPMLAQLAGDGLALVARRAGGAPAGLARGALAIGLTAAAVLGGLGLAREAELANHGGYWRAMQRVNELATEAQRPVVAAASFHWAVQFREGENVELLKLTHPLDRWRVLGEMERERVLDELASVDFFVAHLQAIQQDPRLVRLFAERFRLLEAFYAPDHSRELGPTYLFGAPSAEVPLEGQRLFQTRADVSRAEALRLVDELPRPAGLEFATPPDDEQSYSLMLLGWRLERCLADGAVGELTLYWWAERTSERELVVHVRLSDVLGRDAHNGTARAFGGVPTSEWPAGTLLVEVVPFPVPERTRQFGGPYARGEEVPVELWISVRESGSRDQPDGTVPLEVRDRWGRELGPSGAPPRQAFRAPGTSGRRWNADGMVGAGGGFLPVPPRPVFPTDGGPP